MISKSSNLFSYILPITSSLIIRILSDNNTASHKALAIVSLSSVTVRNGILSDGKRLKGTDFYVHQDLPKEAQKSRKLLRSFFLADRANNKKSTFIGTRSRI